MIDKPEHESEEASPPPSVDSLFEQAREAHKKSQVAQARHLYNEIIERFREDDEAKDIVEQARAFDSLLDREFQAKKMGPLITTLTIIAGLGVWVLIGLGIAAIFSEGMRHWWFENWLKMLLGCIGFIVLFMVFSFAEKKLAVQPEGRRHALTAFIVVPFIALTMMVPIAFGASRMALAMEVVLILVVSLLPAASYYLFLATRRPSILNEFIGNLSRFGLLLPRPTHRSSGDDKLIGIKDSYESHEERRARIESYFQRFEAIYGVLRFRYKDLQPLSRTDFVNNLITSIDKTDITETFLQQHQATVNVTDIFRSNLVIPIGLVTILVTLGWLLVLQPDLKSVINMPDGLIAHLTPTWTPLSFAFLGAYFFGIQMLFRRFVRRDLGANAYFAFSNRIILAVIGVWVAIAAYAFLLDLAGKASAGNFRNILLSSNNQPADWPWEFLVVAFVLGVFPRTLWQLIGAVFSKWSFVKAKIPTIEAKQPLSELDGLTIWHESRLEEEDVENVPNMATVDIVDIMLHTQIPAERLVGWIDQAILYSVLGPKGAGIAEGSPRNKLRDLGLRSATQLVDAFHGDDHQKKALASVLGQDGMHVIVNAIKLEGNYDRVSSWRCINKLGQGKTQV